MKPLLIATLTLTAGAAITLSLIVCNRSVVAQQSDTPTQTKQESPFACDLVAIKPEQRKRKEELNKILRTRRKSIRELKDGFEFEFSADTSTIQAVAEWATLERLCCPFFDFDLRLEREGGPFLLRLTGREGVKDFIKAEFRAE